MLMKSSTQSLTEQLATRFAERIRNRLMAPGARLPSVRQCALQHDVSPSTVVAAYDQLLAQGLVEARKNRGFFVRELTPERADHATQAAGEPGLPGAAATHWNTAHWMAMRGTGRDAPPVNATALIRGMFHKISNKPQPGMGVFPPDWLESTFMPAAVRKVTGTRALQDFSLQYGEPLGDGGLRRVLAKKLASLNVLTAPEHIITTVGATHALDIVSRTLLRAGDPVMVEEPGWAVEFARLSALGMHILPVPRRADGPDLEVMAKYCEAHKPKLYVSVSVFHNPTGYCLSPGSAHRVLQLANQHDFHIVEDDTYSHIAPEHATRLSALDGLQRTIYVSGFAKILAPNWRIGFLAAPPALVEPLLDTKLLATLTTPALLEKALALCIEQGQLRRHAERIRTRLDAARARSVKLALAAGCRFAAEPTGLFGWVDTGVDTDVLAQRMLDEGYLLAPGALFHAARAPSTLMRINFATTQDAAFWRVFTRLVAQR
ncbi:MAG: GntR family transcriptional regulator [Burkholderiales bacterium RIFCSPLOWO2_12_67_14]|nr:MAG: GntR family transcriptional regulator [Burkholderiales bacterium RIFCSPLOWO2_02_FULL_67_64]OGB39698.1 MAG: GntR family transcriptional regulator [Burkholderiales bacterium RIFCSPLOWO2_12_67_14]OGB41159.1 MAG: GntR family transcriptional regulator [Burkholderiales bacterium RIFCSPHIGHO2_12_FULL_67_38]